MKVVRPITLGNGLTLISTNATAADPAYSSGTTYANGARVTVGQRTFESLQDGNIGQPTTDIAWWLDVGASNPYAMFDQSNASQTSRAGMIEVVVSAVGRIDALALLNLNAASVDIEMETTLDGTFYSQSFNLVSNSGINNWYDYYYEPITRKFDFVALGVPNFANPTITLRIHEPGGTAKVGVAIIGRSKDLGDVTYGAKVGIQDYSRKERDDFGNWSIVPRAYSKRGTYQLVVDSARVDEISMILADYRAEPVLWVGSEQYASTWIYGFYRDFSVEISFPTKSYLNLELEGLT